MYSTFAAWTLRWLWYARLLCVLDLSEMSFDNASYKNQVSFDEPQLEFDEESLNIGGASGGGPRRIDGTSGLHAPLIKVLRRLMEHRW